MKFLILLTLISSMIAPNVFASAADELFAPVITKIPKVTVLTREQVDGVELTTLRLEGLEGTSDGKTETCQVFAYEARPLDQGTRKPGMLVCHGGTNSALREKVIGWAKLGYVAISPEFGGYVGRETAQSVARFRTIPYGKLIAVVEPSPQASTLYDSINTGLLAFNLLAVDPGVDAHRIGIVGASWGGFMSLKLATLLGDRVAGVFTLYGTGYFEMNIPGIGSPLKDLDEESRKKWSTYFDVAGYLQDIKAPVFFCAATNDIFFHPPSILASYDSVRTTKYLCFGPNKSHWIDLPGGTTSWTGPTWTDMEPVFFESLWHSSDVSLPHLQITPASGDSKVLFSVTSADSSSKIWVYATKDTSSSWENKVWVRFDAVKLESGLYSAAIPQDWTTFDWYGGISFPATVQGVVHQISLTTPIQSPKTSL